MDPETLILTLLVGFEDTPDRAELLEMVRHVRDGRVIEAKDDGIGQQITVSTGATLVGAKTLKPLWELRPRWTFGEIDPQPKAAFIIRAKGGQGESLPTFSLTLADSSLEYRSVAAIAEWLRARLPEGTVILS